MSMNQLPKITKEEFAHQAEMFAVRLRSQREREIRAAIPFMNGDFTLEDLYLATSVEFTTRMIDGFDAMLEARNYVCCAQILRGQIGCCLRILGLFAAADQDEFLDVWLRGERIDRLKDKHGKKLTEKHLQELMRDFANDRVLEDIYRDTSGFVHFSSSVLPMMGTPGEGMTVEFNIGCEPNSRVNAPLLAFAKAFERYVNLHLSLLAEIVASNDGYAERMTIQEKGSNSSLSGGDGEARLEAMAKKHQEPVEPVQYDSRR
jgi:hypothetical protein